MRRLLIGIILLVIAALSVFLSLRFVRSKIDSIMTSPSSVLSSPTPGVKAIPTTRSDSSLFVPYWTLDEGNFALDPYKSYIYFGITSGSDGINKQEDGYKNLKTFSKAASGKRTLLALRMIDNKVTTPVLKDKKKQEKIINDAIFVAHEFGFDGIVMDLEVSGLPFTSLIDQITSFNKDFYEKAKAARLSYSITAYGDTFYRVRPFSIEELEKSSDMIYVMAYDFHKANGNPGPNFPLAGSDTYGYDYKRMVGSFLDAVPAHKLTFIFGMYGYDWVIDEGGKAKDAGTAISLKETNASLLDDCNYTTCKWEREGGSSEIMIEYSDGDTKHIVWTEDEESTKRKKEYLQKMGIGSFAYWAYSYF